MIKQEEKQTYEIGGKKYIVITRTIENAKSLDKLYEAFSRYALRKLNTNNL